MRGIDVSSHDGWPFKAPTEKAYQGSDFVIVKCTEGTSYLNPHFAKAMHRAGTDGKLLGMYHYAKGGSAALEADYFMANADSWKGRAVPVLDFESYGNNRAADPHWARQFCERVHSKWGVWPMVYTYASMLAKVARCHPQCPLWVAGYPTDADSWKVPAFEYGIAPWDAYAVWQFTSGRETVDRNTSPLSPEQWRALAQLPVRAYTVNAARYLYPQPKKQVAKRIAKVPAGSRVEYLHARSGNWRKVRHDKHEGWVYRKKDGKVILKAIRG